MRDRGRLAGGQEDQEGTREQKCKQRGVKKRAGRNIRTEEERRGGRSAKSRR